MVSATPDGLSGLRDRALLLLGFACAFRRSELVTLNVEDLEPCEAGMRGVRIPAGAAEVEARLRSRAAAAERDVDVIFVQADLEDGPARLYESLGTKMTAHHFDIETCPAR
jgi:hypothetical protein